MKLGRFSHARKESYGVLGKYTIINLPLLAKKIRQPFPPTLEALIQHGETSEARIESLINDASRADVREASTPTSNVKMRAPVVAPPKIVCLGLNYRDHAAEQKKTPPDEPVIFMKPRTAIIGPEEAIIKPSFVRQLDYEAELAIVIGKSAKNVSVEEAKDHIFGYTVFNDISARDIQFKDKQWTRGKGFDTFAPMGPCVALADQLKDTTNLRIRTWVNGELRQDSTTRNMVFNVFEVVHMLSRVMTLEPCDIIATGTPAGVGFAMKPQPKFLNKGDIVEVEVEGIGILQNRVTEEHTVYG
jgi:2-keto-4-pentenoate hydratase/2-oxohepta-3-ene-1,7-dioic acid hydratase in catechol pathway